MHLTVNITWAMIHKQNNELLSLLYLYSESDEKGQLCFGFSLVIATFLLTVYG